MSAEDYILERLNSMQEALSRIESRLGERLPPALTRADVAREMGVCKATVARWEAHPINPLRRIKGIKRPRYLRSEFERFRAATKNF